MLHNMLAVGANDDLFTYKNTFGNKIFLCHDAEFPSFFFLCIFKVVPPCFVVHNLSFLRLAQVF